MPKLQQLRTFKKDEKYLWDEIQRHSGKGNWIKDILADYIKNREYYKGKNSSAYEKQLMEVYNKLKKMSL
jgi:hypothetical protein